MCRSSICTIECIRACRGHCAGTSGAWKLRRTHLLKEFAVRGDQAIETERSISSTGVWKNPDGCVSCVLRLEAPGDVSSTRKAAIGGLAKEGDEPRRTLGNLSIELGGGCGELLPGQQICPRRCALHHGGQAASIPENGAVVVRQNLFGGKPCAMDDSPEPIAAPGEMMSGCDRRHAGVDAAEQHVQAWGDDIREFVGHDTMLIMAIVQQVPRQRLNAGRRSPAIRRLRVSPCAQAS